MDMKLCTMAILLLAQQKDDEWPAGGEKEGLELSIKTEKTTYAAGDDTMELKVRLRNKSSNDKEFTFHHDLAKSLFVRQGTSLLPVIGGRCPCGSYEAGAVKVSLKPGESRTCSIRVRLLANKGPHKIQADGANIWPVKGPLSNVLDVIVQ